MVQCVAHTKSGTRCKRNAEPNSVFCWQHSEESELKFLDVHPEQKIEIPKIIPNPINTNYIRNDLIGNTFQPGILSQILNYANIAPETGKIFNLTSAEKWKFVLQKLKNLYPNMQQWSQANAHDTDILYSILKQDKALTNASMLQILQKNVQYQDLYKAYLQNRSLALSADFLLLIYKNKFFTEFKEYYPIFATRLNQMLLDKYGPRVDDEFKFIQYEKDITYNDHLVVSLYQLENYISSKLSPMTYRYVPSTFDGTWWDYSINQVYAGATEIYLATHKVSTKLKEYLERYPYAEGSPTWAYTVYKNFPNSESATNLIVSNIIHTLPKSLITKKSYDKFGFKGGLDLRVPILNNDVAFFGWLRNIIETYFQKYNYNKYDPNYSNHFISAYNSYVYDEATELNPCLLSKVSL